MSRKHNGGSAKEPLSFSNQHQPARPASPPAPVMANHRDSVRELAERDRRADNAPWAVRAGTWFANGWARGRATVTKRELERANHNFRRLAGLGLIFQPEAEAR